MKKLTQPHIKTRPRPRGNKRSKDEQIRIMNDIFSLSANHYDYEIMETLKIPNETYYRYKSIMYKEAKKIWKQICKESLEYRALHTINSINLALKVDQEIATDPNQPAKDRLEAGAVTCRSTI